MIKDTKTLIPVFILKENCVAISDIFCGRVKGEKIDIPHPPFHPTKKILFRTTEMDIHRTTENSRSRKFKPILGNIIGFYMANDSLNTIP